MQLLARNIPNPSPHNIFLGDLVVCENPLDKGNLLVRRVRRIAQDVSNPEKAVVWVSSEMLNGGIDSKMFGYIPIESILGRACYYYNDTIVLLVVFFELQDHGPIENSEKSLVFDREYISQGEHFFL